MIWNIRENAERNQRPIPDQACNNRWGIFTRWGFVLASRNNFSLQNP